MYAHVFTVQYRLEDLERGTGAFREQLIEKLRQVTGYSGAISLIDPKSGRAVELTFWETEHAMRVGEEVARRLRVELANALRSVTKPVVERYQVAHTDGLISEDAGRPDSNVVR